MEGCIPDLGAFLGYDLHNCRVKSVSGIDWCSAALNVLDIRVIVCDDEGSLELSHVGSVDSEVCL